MSYLSLALLGNAIVSVNNQPLPNFQTERAKALLFFLATERALGTAIHRREALMELLWPGLPLKSARVNLRQTLYLLRQDAPGLPESGGQEEASLLLTDRYRVQIEPDYPLRVDVSEFLDLLGGPSNGWPEAAALYRGDFLSDFYLPDSASFEEWVASRRAAFRRQALDALDKLTDGRLREGAFDEAEQFGRRQLEIDNLRESAYRQLMQLYAWSGRSSEALSLYEECARLLDVELDAAPDEATQELHKAIRENRLPPPPSAAPVEIGPIEPTQALPSPYRGLFAFREEDAPFFFGRDAFTSRLLAAVRRGSLVAVIGPSGSGKSSVVYAGLAASLRGEGGWLVASFRPGRRPFHALAGALINLLEPELSETERLVETGKLAKALEEGDLELPVVVERLVEKRARAEGTPPRLLLIADQFEELFTLVPDVKLRNHFSDTLLSIFHEQRSRPSPICTLVTTLRADFLGQVLSYRPLADALNEADVKLGPMSRPELEQAIANPARKQGIAFAPGLVARILDDVGDEPGYLPLLAFALDALWKQGEGRGLTHEGYEAIGKVEGALARYADTTLAGLAPDGQALARRIFIQMVRPGEGTEDTRRLATRDELGDENWPLVQRLADSRLLVTGRDAAGRETVEMVHEALIRGWGRLRLWLEEDRAFRIWQEQLRAAMRGWLALGRDEGAFLRGAALATAEDWLERRPDDLSVAEREYIEESAGLRQRRQAREEQARAERERLRRTRTWILGAGLLLVTVLAALAGIQWRQAEGQRRALADAQAAIVQERDLAQEALANQLAAEAQNYLIQRPGGIVIEQEQDLDLGLLLALEAVRRSDSQAAYETLVSALASNPRLMAGLQIPGRGLSTIAVSPDGQTLAAAGESAEIRLWQVTLVPFEVEPLEPLASPSAHPIRALAFSPNGAMLLAVQQDGVFLYDLAQSPGAQPEALLSTRETLSEDIRDSTFSPNGEQLVLATGEGTVQLWTVATRRRVASLEVGSYLRTVAFTDSGKRVVAGSIDGSLVVWDLESGESRQADTDTAIFDVAASPDGVHVALVGSPSSLEIWRLDRLERVASASGVEANILYGVTFHPDGRLVSAGNDGHLVLWHVDGMELVPEPLVAHHDIVRTVAFDPGGRWLAAAGLDGLMTIWNADSERTAGFRLLGHEGAVQELVFRDDGSLTSVSCQNWTVFHWAAFPPGPFLACTWSETAIWNTDLPGLEQLHRMNQLPENISGLALAPDGSTAVFGYADGSVVLWDVVENRQSGVFEVQGGEPVFSFAFDGSGGLLATGGCFQRNPGGYCQEGEVRFWELEWPPQEVRVMRGFIGLPAFLALSPNGRWLAASLESPTDLLLWDLGEEEPIPIRLEILIEPHPSVAFHPDNELLAESNVSGNVRLWQLPDGEQVGERVSLAGTIPGLAFSPDGHYLAMGGCSIPIENIGGFPDCPASELVILDLETGSLLTRSFEGHTRSILSLAFSQDSSLLASGDIGGDIMLWDLSITPEKLACRLAGRNLTAAEWESYFGQEPYQPTCPDLAGSSS